MKVTIDYSVWLGVEVDTETGEILRVTHSDDVGAQEPDGFFNADSVESEPEYWPADHPIAVKAMEIADRIKVLGHEVRWEER